MPIATPRSPAACLVAGLLLAGCASAPLDAQWSDPQLTAGNPLRGARVLVVCEAQDLVVRRICQDQVGAQLRAAGATAVPAPDALPASAPSQYLAAAKAADAKAVLVTAVSPDSAVAKSSGFSVGLGVGGGFGGGGFGGVGVSAPIGGTRVATGYAANGTLTEAASGRVMWTARASAAPSSEIEAQVNELAKAIVGGAAKAGLF